MKFTPIWLLAGQIVQIYHEYLTVHCTMCCVVVDFVNFIRWTIIARSWKRRLNFYFRMTYQELMNLFDCIPLFANSGICTFNWLSKFLVTCVGLDGSAWIWFHNLKLAQGGRSVHYAITVVAPGIQWALTLMGSLL